MNGRKEIKKRKNEMLKFIDILDRTSTLVALLVGILVLIMTISVLREVIGRYAFNSPTEWVLEFCEYGLLLLVYLGGAYTLLVDGHVKIDLFYYRWSNRGKYISDIFSSVLGLIYCGVLIWQGYRLAIGSYKTNAVSSGALPWPLFPLQIVVPIGCILLGLQLCSKIYRAKRSMLNDKKERD